MHGTGGSIKLIDGELVRVEDATKPVGTDTTTAAAALGAALAAPAKGTVEEESVFVENSGQREIEG